MTEAQQVELLNAELFTSTEGVQGDAWISDEAGTDSVHEFFGFVESHLHYSRKASKIIAAFLRKHQKLRKAAGRLALRKPGTPPTPVAGWLPIDSAPRDVTLWPYSPPWKLSDKQDQEYDVRLSTTRDWCWATRWQPAEIPAPPSTATREPKP